MTDKALLVGINRYPGAPLAGCVNDIQDMAHFLVNKMHFSPASIRLLADGRATTQAILDRLHWLVADLKAGDRVVFHYSGHGAQVPTRNPEGEVDGLDEVVCIAGDTLIPLADGTEKTVQELAGTLEPFWVYSSDGVGGVRAGRAVRAWKTGGNRPVVRVTLDNGSSVRCTPSHRWMLRDGTYREAGDLREGDSLMPLYRGFRSYSKGLSYETVLNPQTKTWEDTHRLNAGPCPVEILAKAANQNCGTVVHHRNYNSRDNRPENLVWMTWRDHSALHFGSEEFRKQASARSKERWADPSFRSRMSEVGSRAAKARWEDPAYRAMISEASRNQDLTAMREGNEKYLLSLSPEELSSRSSFAGKANLGKKKPKSYSEKLSHRWEDPEYREKMRAAQSASMKRRWASGEFSPNNHKVVSVEPDGTSDVYDLTVPEFSNFAVSAGVFLHNCPVNFDWTDRHLIRDKDFARLFAAIPAGVKFLWVSDSCHSADLSRDVPMYQSTAAPKSIRPPVDIAWRMRSLPPAALAPKSNPLNGVLISGCRSDQTSADAVFGGRYNGALTHYLLQELNTPAGLAEPVTTVVANVNRALGAAGYTQQPQLEGLKDAWVLPLLG